MVKHLQLYMFIPPAYNSAMFVIYNTQGNVLCQEDVLALDDFSFTEERDESYSD